MEGIKDDMMLQQAGSTEEKVLGKTFEEVIGELDEEINKYNSKNSMLTNLGVSMEKENLGGQPTINEACMSCPSIHATNLSPTPRAPLAELPCSFVKHEYTEGVWKRLTRVGVTEDIGMSEAPRGGRGGGAGEEVEIEKQTKLSYQKKEGFHREVQ